MINLNELRDRAYKCACDHGFHDKDYSDEHFLMLTITELSEAVEADRKGKCADRINFKSDNAFQSDHMPEAFIDNFEIYIKDSVEDELADAVIRLLDLFGLRNIFLDEYGFDEETFQDYANIYKDKTFTESIYYIIEELIKHKKSVTESCVLPEIILLDIFGLAKHLNIDLIWFIDQKMKYNELRPKMHGKKY